MINLSENSILLLIICLEKHAPNLLTIVNDDTTIYSTKIYNQLREAVGDELTSCGFNHNWEPNEYGIRLESLIEEIGRLVM